ncbi:MAG: hypothetical protein HYV63_03520 [Candidatus Schekmanbacteria bacterium]|nr:hypothetical protein [Candidatus Schekmanbacteria bacterium]
MSGRARQSWSMWPLPRVKLLACCLIMISAVAGIVPVAAAEDISGIYEVQDEDGSGSALGIATAPGEVMVYFEGGFAAGATVNTCFCFGQGTADGPDRFKLAARDTDGFNGALVLAPDRLVLEMITPACCGVGFPGAPDFPRSARRPLATCTVKSAKAYFLDLAGKPTKKYVISGDRVEATGADPADEIVVARFTGAKVTIGRLAKSDLDCGRSSDHRPDPAR